MMVHSCFDRVTRILFTLPTRLELPEHLLSVTHDKTTTDERWLFYHDSVMPYDAR